MPVLVTIEVAKKSWADAEQTNEGTLIGVMATYEEESEGEEQEFTKADFERDLLKVSRKVKK